MDTKYRGVRYFFPIVLFFVISSGLFLLFSSRLTGWNINHRVLVTGNGILFAATGLSFYFYYRSLQNNQVYYFMRMIYAGVFIKMILCLLATVLYISMAGNEVNKGAIFGCMFLYLLYTFMEIRILVKISQPRKNA